MKSFKEYYKLKEQFGEYQSNVTPIAKAGEWALPKIWRGAKKVNTFANPYAKGNAIGRAAGAMDRFTKRMQGDISADSAEFDAFRRKIAKIYRQAGEGDANRITDEVKKILYRNEAIPPADFQMVAGGRSPDGTELPAQKVYSKDYTAFVQADKRGQLFDLINYNNPKGTGVYKDAHHLANIVLDQMSSFLSGGKYDYKDAARIIYGVPGSTSGMFNPDAIAVLDKHGMLYRQ